MKLIIILCLGVFLWCSKGRAAESSEFYCNQTAETVEFIFSPSYHSAWNPSSNCSLQQCNIRLNNNSCLPSSPACFNYRTLNNNRYCAPGILCSVLELCNNITNVCTSNSSICVINSCCSPSSVCLPLVATNFCQQSIPNELINPCSSGTYWNTTRSIVAGTGSAGNGLNQLNSPIGIYLDSNNSLYIADQMNYRVIKYLSGTSIGTVIAGTTGVYGNRTNLFSPYITSLYVDTNQNLYVVDAYNNRVMRWLNGASNGSIVAGNGTAGSSLNQLYYPAGVSVDSNSNVFVTEYFNQRITEWASGASSGIVVAGTTGSPGLTSNRLYYPTGLFYDETNQDLYISNSNASAIVKWHIGNTNGTVIAGSSGVQGSSTTLLNTPGGITLDQWKNLYVVDYENSRIQLFCNGSRTGITIAGTGTGGSSLSSPADVKLDSQMNLYVSEYNGHRVVKFSKL